METVEVPFTRCVKLTTGTRGVGNRVIPEDFVHGAGVRGKAYRPAATGTTLTFTTAP